MALAPLLPLTSIEAQLMVLIGKGKSPLIERLPLLVRKWLTRLSASLDALDDIPLPLVIRWPTINPLFLTVQNRTSKLVINKVFPCNLLPKEGLCNRHKPPKHKTWVARKKGHRIRSRSNLHRSLAFNLLGRLT